MVTRKYILDPLFLYYNDVEKEHDFQVYLTELEKTIKKQQIESRVFFPGNIVELITEYIYGSDKVSFKKRHDIYKVIMHFFKKVNFQLINEMDEIDFEIIPHEFHDRIVTYFQKSFVTTIIKNKVFSIISGTKISSSVDTVEITVNSSELLHIKISLIENEDEYFPYFLPSIKHCYLLRRQNKAHNSILEKDDHEACHKLIKKSFASDSYSNSLFAFNKITKRFIRFNKDNVKGESYHAYPVEPTSEPLLTVNFIKKILKEFE